MEEPMKPSVLLLAFSLAASSVSAEERKPLILPRLVLVGGHALDAATTIFNLNHGCVELNPRLGTHPSATKIIAAKASATAFTWVAMTAMEKIGWKKGAAVLGYGSGGVGMTAGIMNLSAGCRR